MEKWDIETSPNPSEGGERIVTSPSPSERDGERSYFTTIPDWYLRLHGSNTGGESITWATPADE